MVSIAPHTDDLVWVAANGYPIFDSTGSISEIVISLADITERRQAEQELRESEIKYRSLFDQSAEGVYLHDLTGQILDVNEMACVQSGYTREELLQMTVFDLLPKEAAPINMSVAEILRIWQEQQPEQNAIFEAIHQRKDRSTYPVNVSNSKINLAGQTLMLALTQDITERKQAEQEQERLQAQLMQAQKMESVGSLAGGVAHDFNNMLTVILGHTELALNATAPGEALHEDLTEVHKAAARSANLTRQLLAFARKQTIMPEVLDLNEVIEDMLKMLRRLIGEDIDLAWLPARNLWPVKVDPSQIDQIMANLCVNARDAIDGVGRVTIETGNVVLDDTYCDQHEEAMPGDYAMLSVTDSGSGMSPATMAMLFEPFFTTKEVGKGTGLGLPTVHGIVKQNNGHIDVSSELGSGTTFRVYLPRHAKDAAKRSEETRPAMLSRSRATILLVEDEPAILRMIRSGLERQGYTVLGAATPAEAISLAETYPHKIDLLLSDMVMPEMNGHEVASALRRIRPQVKLVFMSGYTSTIAMGDINLVDDAQFIQKPFAVHQLIAKLNEALGEP